LDFTQPQAVRLLNKALLANAYGIQFWDLPAGKLCPAVPGRLDYIHVLADLLSVGVRSSDRKIRGLDIGTGASLVYPILGVREYGWHMVGTDIDPQTLRAAEAIARFNQLLKGKVELRLQPKTTDIFRGVIREGESFTFSMCNPPFYASAQAAEQANRKKWRKLSASDQNLRNFGGQAEELWTSGGEPAFLRRMIQQSVGFRQNIRWFTSLVSQRAYLRDAKRSLRKVRADEVRVLPYQTGNKSHQVLAWRWSGE